MRSEIVKNFEQLKMQHICLKLEVLAYIKTKSFQKHMPYSDLAAACNAFVNEPGVLRYFLNMLFLKQFANNFVGAASADVQMITNLLNGDDFTLVNRFVQLFNICRHGDVNISG